MRRGRAWLLLLAPFVAGCGPAADAGNMSAEEVAEELSTLRIAPGLWQVNSAIVDVRAPQLPIRVRQRMIGPRGALRHCITPEQAARPSAGFLAGRDDDRCSHRNFTMRGGRLRGTMTCAGDRGGAPVETAMIGRYGPTAYVLRMDMRNPMPDGAVMNVRIISRGRRVGDCPEGARNG